MAKKNVHVHRFGDRVAVSLPGKGETVYLTVKEARKLARALNGGARDIDKEPRFSQSGFVTVSFEVEATCLYSAH
jgi:hypothetical protein